MQVVWSNEAGNDLEQIWTYLAQQASIEVADNQSRKIVAVCSMLSDWPQAGRVRDAVALGIRSIASEPYLIFYRIGADAVQIVRVLHGRRDHEAILSEAP